MAGRSYGAGTIFQRGKISGQRTISECFALAEAHEKESREGPVLDPDFAADVEEIVCDRKPWNPPTWD